MEEETSSHSSFLQSTWNETKHFGRFLHGRGLIALAIVSLLMGANGNDRNTERAIIPPDLDTPRIVQGLEPGELDTSAVLAGSIAVQPIFVDSNGQVDPDVFDWTEEQKQIALNNLIAGTQYIASKEPDANVVFNILPPINIDVATEPTLHDYGSPEGVNFIWEALTKMGQTGKIGEFFMMARREANKIRNEQGTDWAYLAFFVAGNEFTDGTTAGAYINGPMQFSVSRPWQTHAHEAIHIFGGLDEYFQARIDCLIRSGYFFDETQNSEYPYPGACKLNIRSIMRGDLDAYPDPFNPYTRGQIGWGHTNDPQLLDLAGTYSHTLRFDIDSNGITAIGRLINIPAPVEHPNWQTISINRIAGAYFKNPLTGQRWAATASDGAFDNREEDIYGLVPDPVPTALNFCIEGRVGGTYCLPVPGFEEHKMFLPLILR